MNNTLPYSAINNTANKPPLYSILKPETNSDSLSEKSKGVRFTSAKIVTTHIKKININKNTIFSIILFKLLILLKLKEFLRKKKIIIIKQNLTS